MTNHVIRFNDNRGGLAYPFLPAAWQWEIVSRPLSLAIEENGGVPVDREAVVSEILQAPTPTLRWVKDDKVLDLYVPGMDTAAFLARTGLQLSLAKGGYALSKRLSRIMRPFRTWGFFAANEVVIRYDESLDGRLWDGCGLVSPRFVRRLAEAQDLTARQRAELRRTSRFEVTTLHACGQDKGHVLVSPRAEELGCDLLFPAGSAKPELRLGETPFGPMTFVGLQPVHSSDQMCLDIQSLINLHPFLSPEQLLAWAEMESGLFLERIRSGRSEGLLDRLTTAESPDDLANLAGWPVGEYIASGGRLMWFAGMVKGAARQHLKRLGSRENRLRCPAPGGRYYIFPEAVGVQQMGAQQMGAQQVAPGQVKLDPAAATVWVNDQDWLDYLVKVLGGCDGDDAVWVLPFTDRADGARKLLLWRSPNQVGEYVLLAPTAGSHTLAWATAREAVSYPLLDSRLLPPRIDAASHQVGTLPAAGEAQLLSGYTPQAMASTIQQAAANLGVLGAYCNALMLCKALYGRLPDTLPASLEAVIDGSVKTGLDLQPVRAWNRMAMARMVRHGRQDERRGLPEVLRDRLPEKLQKQAVTAQGHWLDALAAALQRHKAAYWADVAALATEACPPVALFAQGQAWLHVGKELRQAYSQVLREELAAYGLEEEVPETVYAAARAACASVLGQWPEEIRPYLLLGAAAYLYAQGPQQGQAVQDGVLWQLGEPQDGGGRQRGIAQEMLAALRQVGLLDQPVWTAAGGIPQGVGVPDRPLRHVQGRLSGVPVRLNGVWFNLLRATAPETPARMQLVPPAARQAAKARIAAYVQAAFRGMVLHTAVTDNNRVVARTARGNLFGYVQRDHELAALRYDRWHIAWACAVDGNVLALLEPAPEG